MWISPLAEKQIRLSIDMRTLDMLFILHVRLPFIRRQLGTSQEKIQTIQETSHVISSTHSPMFTFPIASRHSPRPRERLARMTASYLGHGESDGLTSRRRLSTSETSELCLCLSPCLE